MEYLVIVNRRSKAVARDGDSPTHVIRRSFEQAGVSAQVEAFEPDRVRSVVDHASQNGTCALVAVGGDGTVNAIASMALEAGLPLAVLPGGTLNHFAKDVGVPIDLAAAVRGLPTSRETRVDVGEVNGHLFLNNASLGVYPSIVRRRKELRHRFGWGKWPALSFALVSLGRRFPMLRVELDLDGRVVERTTPFVFVGNNRYDLHLFQLGARQRLDEGLLCVYLSGRRGRWGTVRLLLRALVDRLDEAKDFARFERTSLVIRSGHDRLRVALDGELHHLATPLRFTVRPKALRLLVQEASA